MYTTENERLVRAYIESVWNGDNLDFIPEVWAADRVAECRAGWISNRRFCPNGRFTIDELIAQGDKVVVRWTLEGAQSGGWRTAQHGPSSNGRLITITGITIWCIQDGRLVDSYYASDGPGIYE